MRALLSEVVESLGPSDAALRRNVRLLVGELIPRLLSSCPHMQVQLELEIKEDSILIAVADLGDAHCDCRAALDEAVFSDLTSAWRRDGGEDGGARFEIVR